MFYKFYRNFAAVAKMNYKAGSKAGSLYNFFFFQKITVNPLLLVAVTVKKAKWDGFGL